MNNTLYPVTELLYLKDADGFSGEAEILDVVHEDDRLALVLDQTLFYPKGGGQPSDRGWITGPQGVFAAQSVELKEGLALHFGGPNQAIPNAGDQVSMVIDRDVRLLHSRIHSAGELLCAVMRDLGYCYPGWPVTAAIHYPERASVQFGGVLSQEERDRLGVRLSEEANRLIAQGNRIRVATVNGLNEAAKLCGYLPDYLPEGEPIRIVTVHGEIGRPCQGTHVNDLQEIGKLEIISVKSKKGTTTVSYWLEGMD